MAYDARFSPDLGELTETEAKKLGELMEHPAWPLFVKYLHIERWSIVNNGIIIANKEQDYGYCQGSIGQINKIEADMEWYHGMSQTVQSVERSVSEHNKLEREYFAEYNDDEELPLAP